MTAPFIAEIKMFGFNFAPRGYAFCNGQLIAIAQNTALFSLLGVTYGGNGTTTFALPNLQGRAVMNAGQGPGLTNRTLGELGGVTSVVLTASELPAHTHGVVVAATADGIADRSNAAGNVLAKAADSTYAAGAGNTSMNTGSTTSAGSGGAHNNLQPYLALNFCIALQGIFPSRN
jgi:microcystin-dependent protein